MQEIAKQIVHKAVLEALREYGSYNVGNFADYCQISVRRYHDVCYKAFRQAFVNDVTDMNRKVLNACLNVLDSERPDQALTNSGLLEWSTKDFDTALRDRRISQKEYDASRTSVKMIEVLREVVAYPAPIFKPVSISISATDQFKNLKTDLLKPFED